MAAFTGWSSEGYNTLANSLAGLGQQLGKGLETGRQKQLLSDFGAALASGDSKAALALAPGLNDPNLVLNLYKQQVQLDRDSKSDLVANGGGLPSVAPTAPATGGQPLDLPSSGSARGDRNNNFGNMNDGKFTQSQPGYTGSDGRFAQFDTPQHGFNAQVALLDNYGRQGVNTIAGIVGKWAPAGENGAASTNNYIATVSRDLGVSPNTPLDLTDPNLRATVARSMAGVELGHKFEIPTGAVGGYPGGPEKPTQVASNNPAASANPAVSNDATPAPGGSGAGSNIAALKARSENLTRALLMPGISDDQRQKLNAALAAVNNQIQWGFNEQNLPGPKTAAEIQAKRIEGQKAGLTGQELADYALGRKVDQTEYSKETDKSVAKRFSSIVEEGDGAREQQANVARLGELNAALGSGNYRGAQEFLSKNFGIAVGDKVSEVEAYSSLISKMVPAQRAPGAGSSSDFDAKGYLASLPGLLKTPEGRQDVINTMTGLNNYKLARAQIAERTQLDPTDPEYLSRGQAVKELRGLSAKSYIDEARKSSAPQTPQNGDQSTAPDTSNQKKMSVSYSGGNIPPGFNSDLAGLNAAIAKYPARAQEFRDMFLKNYPGAKFE